MKRILSIFLLTFFLISIFPAASASSDIMPYASQVFDELGSHITFSGGKVRGAADVSSWVTADKLGMSSMALYENNDSGGWTRIASASGKYGYNTTNYSYTISATATAGKEYKFVVTFYGKAGGVTDTLTHTKYA